MACDNNKKGLPVVLIHPADNVLICIRDIDPGEVVEIEGLPATITDFIPLGHKIARKNLAQGDKIYRYGMAIGTMVKDAGVGDHIHTHNLKSDYIPSHHRDAAQIGGKKDA